MKPLSPLEQIALSHPGPDTPAAAESTSSDASISPYHGTGRFCASLNLFVMPGDLVPFEISFSVIPGTYRLFAESGSVIATGNHRWEWIAPQTLGQCRLLLSDRWMIDVLVIDVRVGVQGVGERRSMPETVERDDDSVADALVARQAPDPGPRPHASLMARAFEIAHGVPAPEPMPRS
jgi:hypothetical protein